MIAAICCLSLVRGFVRAPPPRLCVVPTRGAVPFPRATSVTLAATTSATVPTPAAASHNVLADVLDRATKLFPVWVVTLSFLGMKQPRLFDWFRPLITPALALTMLCMGMSLTIDDFKVRVWLAWMHPLPARNLLKSISFSTLKSTAFQRVAKKVRHDISIRQKREEILTPNATSHTHAHTSPWASPSLVLLSSTLAPRRDARRAPLSRPW